MNEKIIENAIDYIQELFQTNAGGHDAEHTMRVYRNTLLIAEKEPGKRHAFLENFLKEYLEETGAGSNF